MSLSIAVHHLLVTKLQLRKTDAPVLIAEMTGKGERTVREWRAVYPLTTGSPYIRVQNGAMYCTYRG